MYQVIITDSSFSYPPFTCIKMLLKNYKIIALINKYFIS